MDLNFIFGLINSFRLSLTRSIILFSSNLVNLSLVGSFWRLSNLHPFGVYHEIHFKHCNWPSVMTHISYPYQPTETVVVLQSYTHTFLRMLLFNVLYGIPHMELNHSNSNQYHILSVFLPERVGLQYSKRFMCSWRNVAYISGRWSPDQPITMAARPEAWSVFARSNIGIVVSNPTRCMDVCVRLFCVCVVLRVSSGLATADHSSKESYRLYKKITKLKKRPEPNKEL
jgi:hypothetical protein